ncbi:MAG: hypothetical protein KDC24_15160, partial [Saprospiraceae bacterium]|nr:hypothetical protein [Saprospiraceae bacterium]
DRLKAIYEIEEPAFDPDGIAKHYIERLQNLNEVEIFTKNTVVKVNEKGGSWDITLRSGDSIAAGAVINATYAGTNAIQQVFNQPLIDIVYELSEICLTKPGAFADTALTVMDGPFCSYMPFGHSGLHSLSSVLYTHHAKSDQMLPIFSCQDENQNCKPQSLENCTTCAFKPATAFEKMRKQLQHYITDDCLPKYVASRFTVKTKLKASHIDDSRPTEIGQFQKNPAFYCIFAGKINAVYEIEKVLNI